MITSKRQTLIVNETIFESSSYFQGDRKFLERVKSTIYRHLDDEEFRSVRLCREMGISRSQLFRKIKELTGYSTALYIRQIRLQKSKELLAGNHYPIKIVAYAVGFRDIAYFSRCFKKAFGCSPSQFRMNTLVQSAVSS